MGKYIFLFIVGSFSAALARADFQTEMFKAVLESKGLASLVSEQSKSGLQLMEVSDTGNRYKCMCLDYKVVFKAGKKTESKVFYTQLWYRPMGLDKYEVSVGDFSTEPRE